MVLDSRKGMQNADKDILSEMEDERMLMAPFIGDFRLHLCPVEQDVEQQI